MAAQGGLSYKPISADSHVTEPPNCFLDYIDPKFRDRAPRVRPDQRRGFVYAIDGMPNGVAFGTVAAAGKAPKDIKFEDGRWEDLHKGGYDGAARIADMNRDGLQAELIYPTVGMVLCGHPDADYKRACFEAYHRWLEEFISAAPTRLFGMGQTAIRTVAEGVEDLRRMKEAGFRGVMMPLHPATEFDYDDARFDPFWQAAVELSLPVSFHIAAGQTNKDKEGNYQATRGPASVYWTGILRSVQDVIGMMIFSGRFDRHPDLKIVCVEGDAGWVPHMMYRMDHAYNRHRYWMKGVELATLPSGAFKNNIRFTFQDDLSAFQAVAAGLLDPSLLMWASDFPHSDSTWPDSLDLLCAQTKGVSEPDRRAILRDNVIALYNLPAAA
jgi:predicted TIM-barrel fold metal-dependent hydrolase